MPTKAEWQAANQADPDIQIIMRTLQDNSDLNKNDLNNKAFYTEWSKDKLNTSDKLLYQLEEPK